jgi:ADP-ribose pyrophosphatase
MSQDDHLREETILTEQVWRGRLLDVRRDTVRLPDGREATREYIAHPGAVMIVPILPDGRLVMERQWRTPLKRVMLEFPAGKLDAGEAPAVCAQRELFEETGYRAAEWANAGQLHIAIAYCDEVIHLFLARGLVAGERVPGRGGGRAGRSRRAHRGRRGDRREDARRPDVVAELARRPLGRGLGAGSAALMAG